MIERYDIPVISDIWNTQTKYKYFLAVETALLQALEEEKVIPQGVSSELDKILIKPERIDELDLALKHDVIAFCTSITEQMSAKNSRFFHFGVTSSDIIDTALMLQLRDSVSLIKDVLYEVIEQLIIQIDNSSDILGMGRSHGIYAEPMIFAQKWLGHLAEFLRRYEELDNFEFTGQFSGAVGNYSVLNTKIEKKALDKLALKKEIASTQVIPRDRIASLVQIFSLLGCAIERLAVEIRHLHHSDINEVCEGFSAGQKGSSTMPHKKNPISSENLTGLSRMLRSYSGVALDNTLLWHERDISHSAPERMYLPDMFGISYYALKRLSSTLKNLEYNKKNIEEKVVRNPQAFSSLLLHKLILETEKTREELYQIVQKATFDYNSLPEIMAFIAQETEVNLETFSFEHLKEKYQKEFKQNYLELKKKYSLE